MNIPKIDPRIAIAGASAASLAVGAVGGYFLAKKRITAAAVAWAEEEIASEVAAYKRYMKAETPEKMAERLDIYEEAKDAYPKYRETAETPENPEVVPTEQHNIWQMAEESVTTADELRSNEDWWEREKEIRAAQIRSGRAYLITEDEFLQEGLPNQVSYEFYADGVLVDEQNQVVELADSVVGSDNLERFGEWTNNPNMVFVRNESLELDFEITRFESNYGEIVAGFVPRQIREPETGYQRSWKKTAEGQPNYPSWAQ